MLSLSASRRRRDLRRMVKTHRAKVLRKAERERRFESAKDNRLTKEHWNNAQDSHINADLNEDLATLRLRSQYEQANNGMIAGIVQTLMTDVVGDGPRLQVLSDNKDYNAALEEAWNSFYEMPDFNEQLDGTAMLRMWVVLECGMGEYFAKIVNKRGADTTLALRIQQIHPRRLNNPLGADHLKTYMGIKVDEFGKPVAYFVEKSSPDGTSLTTIHDTLEPSEVLHGFEMMEPGQLRGVPKLAPVLNVVGQLRDYDKAVQQAALAAAKIDIVLQAEDGDTDKFDPGDEMETETGTMYTLPPGYTANQIMPQQPGNMYQEFRAEKHREIGRAYNMPLMMVNLDSSKHSYSSARFDGQLYNRYIGAWQRRLERQSLNRLLEAVEAESRMMGLVSARPSKVKFNWVWPKPPHVDPMKEAEAERVRLVNRTKTFADACADTGQDWEVVLQQLNREIEAFAEMGMEHPAVALMRTAAGAGRPANEDGEGEDDKAKPAKKEKEPAHAQADDE